ncbi:MAG: trigger factor [Proteobacteria bacterium]|nr:trigger factor [Pseudomonadota bacterium]
MRVSLEQTGALERRLEVSVPNEEVEKAFDDRLKTFSRTARLKGFRPGKAPIAVVKRQFGPQLRDEVMSEIVRQSLGVALNQHRLEPVGGPRIEALPASVGDGLRYAAFFEVYPTVELKGLDTIEVERPTAEVGATEIDAMIETLRKQRPNYVPAGRAAADGDRVTVDFEGRLDGTPFEGGKGEGVAIVLGQGRMLKDFEAGILGAAAGETRSFPVTFPADYGKAELAGKTTEFTVTVKTVEAVELPVVDEAFCLAFGVAEGGVEQLRREVEDNMRRELKDTVRNRVKTQLLDKLVAANPVDLPRASVDNQVRALQVDWLRRVGARPEDLKEAPPREPFEQAARRRVAIGLLIAEVIRREGIQTDARLLDERIEAAAVGYSDPEDAARQIRANDNLRAQLESAVLEDQAVEWLLGKVKVVDQPTTFKDLMNFGA